MLYPCDTWVLFQPPKRKISFDIKFLLDKVSQYVVNFEHIFVFLPVLEVYAVCCFIQRCVVDVEFALLRIKTTCLHFNYY